MANNKVSCKKKIERNGFLSTKPTSNILLNLSSFIYALLVFFHLIFY